MSRSQLELILKLTHIFLFILGIVAAAVIFSTGLFAGYALFVFLIIFGVLGGIGIGLNYFFQTYLFGLRRLAEGVKLISKSNPAYRLPAEGSREMRQLVEAINAFADRFQAILTDQEANISQAKVDLEEEKNRLAVLMSELTEGVLVCNAEGRILLYNSRARHLLSQVPDGQSNNPAQGFVGLGRSIFGLIDRASITHALEELSYRREKERTDLVFHFVTAATNGQLIRTTITPLLDQQQKINGFVLTMEDITHRIQASSRRDILLQSLTEGTRASLANIRAAIETIEAYPAMDPVRLSQLHNVIHEEALTLSGKLEEATAEYAADLRADWQLEEMLGSDLIWAIQRRFEDKLGIRTQLETQEENLWLKVDSYAVIQAMTYIMCQLKDNFEVNEILFRLEKSGRLAAFDMIWHGTVTDMETLWLWQNQALIANGEGTPLTLREVAERHGGEVWCQSDKNSNTTYFRLLLPTTQPRPGRAMPVILESRPEYYDFDLFHQPGQKPELDQRSLLDLTYTVFDTETTGLDPSAGDEIISISAVRIVNGRLLRQEIFDQLIDPRRSISPASIEVHGILPTMLLGQPTIEQVLPLFHRFAEDTVLVAHNAAFDMRLLQLKEAQTGIKFINPVLDTLLLSAVVQPNQDAHTMETIAQRLGVNIIGRHTSLGDAMMTGEIFLKLIPLLAERDIITLAEARRAAQKSYYARISY